MKRQLAPILVWLCAAALMPAEVSAQLIGSDSPPPESVRRPYRGLFGNPGDPNATQSLVLSASLFGAYDDNVAAGVLDQDNNDPRLTQKGYYYGATAALNYSLSKAFDRSSFSIGSGVGVSGYEFDGDNNIVPNAHVTGGFSHALAQRTSISVSQRVIYSRYYRFLLFPGLNGADDDGALSGDPDLELFARTALRYGTTVGFEQGLGARSTLSVGYDFYYVDYQDDEFIDWRNQRASVNFDRRLTQHATLQLGYGYRVAESRGGDDIDRGPREAHDVNLGVSYSRALSFSRRTSFAFSTGSAVLVRDEPTAPGTDPTTRFRLLGQATLNHEIGRSWTAQAAYNRGFVFREGFDDPFYTDALSASIGGFVTRRLDLSAVARWSLAQLDQQGTGNGHDAFGVSVQSRFALSQFVALFARYVYYQYEFGPNVPVDPNLARALDRQGVRVGVTAFLPLIR